MRIRELIESVGIKAIHRTSAAAARKIMAHGFDLQYFGAGAGAGSGEPAGVFVSVGDGEDFSRENTKRELGLDVVLRLQLHVDAVLRWDADKRVPYAHVARIEFIQTRFGLSDDDVTAIIRYMPRILRVRPDLDRIADWAGTREGERELALFINEKLQAEGYDAVSYRDPWQRVEQMIVLDPSKIEIIHGPDNTRPSD